MESLTKTLKLLGHPDRLRILSVLRRGELTVSELTTVLDLSQPRVTQYVGSLEEAGLIERLREGSWVFARLRRGHDGILGVVARVLDSIPANDPTLLADRERLTSVRRARAASAEGFFADVANNRGQLSHEFLPSAPTEAALLAAADRESYRFMIDLGTGSGRMLELFCDRVARGIGFDLSPDMLRVARHKLVGDRFAHLSVQLGDITDTRLADGAADLVVLHQVLHYLDDPQEALAEAARLLAPGGTLLIADFAAHDREAFRDRFAHRRLGFETAEIEALLKPFAFGQAVAQSIPGGSPDAPDIMIWTAHRASDAKRTAA